MILLIILFILGFSVLILIHEWGHFFVAKKLGMRVEEFALGFFKRIASIKRGDTEYSINLVPIGGYVKIYGEEDNAEDPESFFAHSVYKRMLVVVAGVVVNFIFAIFLLTIVFSIGTLSQISDTTGGNIQDKGVYIASIQENSSFKKAGLLIQDRITHISIEETMLEIQKPADIVDFIQSENFQTPFKVAFVRNGEEKQASVGYEPNQDNAQTSFILGGIVSYPVHESVWQATKTSVWALEAIPTALYGVGADLVETGSVEQGSIAGPIGIVDFVNDSFDTVHIIYFLQIMAFISITLAFFNILPIPAVDGGKLLFLIIEAIKGSPINPNIENTIHKIGFLVLIVLILLITFNDINNIL